MLNSPDQVYVSSNSDLKQRLKVHNSGGPVHTAHRKPRKIVTYLGFDDEPKARQFERYLKFHSGRAFARKRLW